LRREALLVLLAELHDPGHVALVERRQDRRLLAALDEALGDALAERRHGDALLRARAELARGRRDRSLRHGPEPRELALDVLREEPPRGPARRDRAQVEVVLAREPAE